MGGQHSNGTRKPRVALVMPRDSRAVMGTAKYTRRLTASSGKDQCSERASHRQSQAETVCAVAAPWGSEADHRSTAGSAVPPPSLRYTALEAEPTASRHNDSGSQASSGHPCTGGDSRRKNEVKWRAPPTGCFRAGRHVHMSPAQNLART